MRSLLTSDRRASGDVLHENQALPDWIRRDYERYELKSLAEQ